MTTKRPSPVTGQIVVPLVVALQASAAASETEDIADAREDALMEWGHPWPAAAPPQTTTCCVHGPPCPAAPPAARDDPHHAVPLSAAERIVNDVFAGASRKARDDARVRLRGAALRAAATPTTPAEHVPVPINALETLLASYAHGSGEVDPVEAIAAFDSLRAALAAAQQDANNE